MARPVVLCVDDERGILDVLREQLHRRLGRECVVELADSGDDALAIVDELVDNGDDIAVVISDQIMPGMKGDELLAKVHERLPETRNILLTGQASVDAVGAAVNRARLYRFLSKPWDAEDLELTVRSALESFFGDRAREEQRAMLREMSEVSLALTANLAGADRYSRLVESARRILRADRVVVFRREDEALLPLASSEPGPGPLLLSGELAAELAADLAAAQPTRRSGAAAAAVSSAALGWRATDRSMVSVPLRVGGEAVGLLVAASDRVESLRSSGDERVTAFAALAAASIRTTELVDALEAASEQRQQVALELQREASRRGSGALLGQSSAIQQVRRDIAARATAARPTLIVGPPGSGCEAAAQSIHEQSAESGGPFIRVESVLVRDARELLGGERTSAATAPSKLELAQGGTLYLAGIEGLPRAIQQELAARIEEGAGARILAMARRDPASMLDPRLYACFDGHRVQLPALRDRLEDLPALAEHFLRVHSVQAGREVDRVTEASFARMMGHAWPGNVRELGHVMERAVLTATSSIAELPETMFSGVAVGSYQLGERLGSGGMGEVWRAHHTHLARPAAVKLIRGAAKLGPSAIERFRREAAATAKLRSPHTVELYDFGVTADGEPYFVMELLEGLDLDSLVNQYGPVRPERAIHLVRQACLSLGEAHAAGLAHRDVKPANLFTCRLGLELDFLKVLDFGMVSGAAGDAALTQDGLLAGTPAFMAPEGLSGTRDSRADLYALGCVLHWLLTGHLLFDYENLLQIMMAHVEQAPPLTSTLARHHVPAALDALIQRCLSKDPEARPPSAMALFEELGALDVEPWTRARAQEWWTGVSDGSISPSRGSTTSAVLRLTATSSGRPRKPAEG